MLFLDIPIESLRLLSFFPLPPLVHVFLSSFLSPFLLENIFIFLKHILLIIQHHLKAGRVSDEPSCGLFIFCLSKIRQSSGGTSPEAIQAVLGEGAGKPSAQKTFPYSWGGMAALPSEVFPSRASRDKGFPDCHFVGFSFTVAHFPGRPAAVLSQGRKLRLKVFDKTTLVTPILSKPLWRRGPAVDRLEN